MTTTKNAQKTVQEVMQAHPVTISIGTSIREVAEILEGNGISGAPVVDTRGQCVGIISRTDVLHCCLEGPLGDGSGNILSALDRASGEPWSLDPESLGMAEDVMTDEVLHAEPGEPLSEVAHRMSRERVHRLVVLDEQRQVIGMISSLDVLGGFPK